MNTTAFHGRKSSTILPMFLLAIFALPAHAETQWSMRALGYLSNDQQYAASVEHLVFDMNNLGQVVGWSIGPPEERFEGYITHPLQAFVTAANGGEILANLGKIEPYMESTSRPYAINDLGQVVYYVSRLGSMPGHIISGPPYTSTEGLGVGNGGPESPVVDINNHGIAVAYDGYSTGYSYTIASDNDPSTYRYGPGTPAAPGIPSGINDANQIALHDWDGNNISTAYIWSENAGLRQITPDGAKAFTAGINDEGQIIGTLNDSPFITGPDGGALNFLDIIGSQFELTGLNDLGQVVGQYRGEDDLFHAFFTGPNGEGITELASLDILMNSGWSDLRLGAINNLGQMAGTGTIDGVRRPFFITPVPEPETYAMMLAGLSVLGLVRRRKQKQP
jgi:uncharacterized membrane protein